MRHVASFSTICNHLSAAGQKMRSGQTSCVLYELVLSSLVLGSTRNHDCSHRCPCTISMDARVDTRFWIHARYNEITGSKSIVMATVRGENLCSGDAAIHPSRSEAPNWLRKAIGRVTRDGAAGEVISGHVQVDSENQISSSRQGPHANPSTPS